MVEQGGCFSTVCSCYCLSQSLYKTVEALIVLELDFLLQHLGMFLNFTWLHETGLNFLYDAFLPCL